VRMESGGNSDQKGALAMRIPHVGAAAHTVSRSDSRQATTSSVLRSGGHIDRTSLQSILPGQIGTVQTGGPASLHDRVL